MEQGVTRDLGEGWWHSPCQPLDVDDLIERVETAFEAAPSKRRRGTPSKSPAADPNDGNTEPCPEPVELILYVSSHSTYSAAAIRTIKKVLSRFERSKVRLTVRDLREDPTCGAEDGVAFTPTLVRRTMPRTFILGHMSNPNLLLDLLAECEDDRT
jgi:KaiB-like protein